MNTLRIPFRPYSGTSGWSGSDTSRTRAVTSDRDGTTTARQQKVLDLLSSRGYDGVIWHDVAAEFGWHHGTASGVLSVLHKEGAIVRLAETRNRCKVYVSVDQVEGRASEAHGRKPRPCSACGHTE